MTPEELVAQASALDAAVGERLGFLVELDRLKGVLRRSYAIADSGVGPRRENSAEHSWHVALFAWVLAPLLPEPVDVGRVVHMLLVHDIVEIDADDTFVYDTALREAKVAVEQAAADRLFGLLPPEQGAELRALWDEFEAKATPEARFAAAVDRLQPLLLNLLAGGRTWSEHGITDERVRAINGVIGDASPRLWDVASALLDGAVARGDLEPGP